jgi:Spy/CpxP family protein refolding chaperone
MTHRITKLAGVLALLLVAASASAQQDTTRAAPGARARMPRAGMGMGHMQGMMGHMGALMGGAHIGPARLLAFKDELGLTAEQVTRLEKIRDDHHPVMMAMQERVQAAQEAFHKARQDEDWGAMERSVDELARLHADQVKSHLQVERQSLEVLTQAQRQKLDTWQEGARLFRGERMRMRQHMRQGMMQQTPTPPAPPPPPPRG